MYKKLLKASLVLLQMTSLEAVNADGGVRIYAETYPPFNYIGPDGQIAGYAVERVQKVMRAAGLSYQISLLPWSRALAKLKDDDRALLFSVTRTPDREQEFTWLSRLANVQMHIYGRATFPHEPNLSLLRSGEVRVVCLKDDVTCALLRTYQIPVSSILSITNRERPDFLFVERSRADFLVAPAMLDTLYVKSNHASLKRYSEFGPELAVYLVGSKSVESDISESIRANPVSFQNRDIVISSIMASKRRGLGPGSSLMSKPTLSRKE